MLSTGGGMSRLPRGGPRPWGGGPCWNWGWNWGCWKGGCPGCDAFSYGRVLPTSAEKQVEQVRQPGPTTERPTKWANKREEARETREEKQGRRSVAVSMRADSSTTTKERKQPPPNSRQQYCSGRTHATTTRCTWATTQNQSRIRLCPSTEDHANAAGAKHGQKCMQAWRGPCRPGAAAVCMYAP